ncbi:hypothetical protein JCM10914A_30690 [Paenibacillus sp. JCM 10914]|uniref:hypothetical protein n=1 Tax=Paenibacillus sp. JCM 10914 TaxID=1236974 RepID=UPI00055C848D|nr:hypothetical protein [Paenibacillus sp. JCM 10914]
MPFWCKLLWIGAAIFGVYSLIWFVMGATSNFQRQMDLPETVKLMFLGGPTLFLLVLSFWLFIVKWNISSKVSHFFFIVGLLVLITFSIILIKNTTTEGWLEERVKSDSIKITSDQLYEYRIDLVNAFQKNSYARLYVRDVSTNEEKNIALDIETRNIVVLFSGVDKTDWVYMEPTDISGNYILNTTEELGIPEERFKIDMELAISKKLN